MSLWIYPGSFDPVTLGHMDIIRRGAALCDRLLVVIMVNEAKKSAFTLEERCDMVRRACADLPNVEVETFPGLQVDFYRQVRADAVLRGIRGVSDLEWEKQVDACNKLLMPSFETVLLFSRPEYEAISSSVVRAVGKAHGNLSAFVPACLCREIEKRLVNCKMKLNT